MVDYSFPAASPALARQAARQAKPQSKTAQQETYVPFCSLECNREYSAVVVGGAEGLGPNTDPWCLNCGESVEALPSRSAAIGRAWFIWRMDSQGNPSQPVSGPYRSPQDAEDAIYADALDGRTHMALESEGVSWPGIPYSGPTSASSSRNASAYYTDDDIEMAHLNSGYYDDEPPCPACGAVDVFISASHDPEKQAKIDAGAALTDLPVTFCTNCEGVFENYGGMRQVATRKTAATDGYSVRTPSGDWMDTGAATFEEAEDAVKALVDRSAPSTIVWLLNHFNGSVSVMEVSPWQGGSIESIRSYEQFYGSPLPDASLPAGVTREGSSHRASSHSLEWHEAPDQTWGAQADGITLVVQPSEGGYEYVVDGPDQPLSGKAGDLAEALLAAETVLHDRFL